ncbi:MAG TPA: TetR/AcrR family transcriptional regulator [Phycisphaerales bacterium]|nr:TetR/AcrR family transcriptional regulator [Phycisphaerales bacterium]
MVLSCLYMATRSQKRVVRTRRSLMDAGLSAFTEYGVDASTIEMITERADLGKGTFYRYFSDKETLLLALIEQAVDGLLEAIKKAVGTPRNLEEVLHGLVRGHMDFFLNNREGYVLLFQGRVLLKLDREVGEIGEPYHRYLAGLEALVRPFAPAVDPVKVRRLACAVAGFVSGFLSFAMIAMDPDSLERNIEPMRKAFVDGMMAFMGRP